MIDQKAYDRFMEKVCPEPNSGCWLWMGSWQPCGTAATNVRGKTERAAPLSYLWHKGALPAGHIVHHICNIHACVNPDHLVPATRQENVVDAHYRRGRPPQILSLETTLGPWRKRQAELAAAKLRRLFNGTAEFCPFPMGLLANVG